MPRLLVIVGPTAVGKTATSIEVAQQLNGAVISADSMQVYRGMDIGTGKVRPEETRGVKHYLIDILDPGDVFSVAQYVELADAAIQKVVAQGQQPIIVGGTGLYIRALVDGFLFADPGPDYLYRAQMEKTAAEQGVEAVHQLLAQVDPESAQRIHSNDLKRVIRALEVYHTTGEKLSAKIAQTKKLPPRYAASFYGLTAPRQFLYQRIDQRIEQMLEDGLVREVMGLLSQGLMTYLTSNQAIGYKEIVEYLSGKATYAAAVDKLKQANRNYAKRQLSWFRRDSRIKWFDITAYSSVQELGSAIVQDFGGYKSQRREDILQ